MSNKAEAGIGSLILFIALIMVAAAAAAVFIQTSTSLQGKALLTAGGAQKQVATRVLILQAWGENASNTGNLGDIYFKVKLAPGSDSINLNSSLVAVSTDAFRQSYKFNVSGSCNRVNLSSSSYTNQYLLTTKINSSSFKSGFLQEGDMVDMCVRLPSNVSTDSRFTLQFVPSAGTITQFSITTPSVMTDVKTQIYP